MQQSGSSPIRKVVFVSHVNKYSIVLVCTFDCAFVLADSFLEASTCFTDVMTGAGGARDGIRASLALAGRRRVDQALTEGVGLPEGEVGTSLLQGALETL